MTGSETISCPQCEHPARASDRFCGSCGFDLATHRASLTGRAMKQTMVGLSPPGVGDAPAGSSSSVPPPGEVPDTASQAPDTVPDDAPRQPPRPGGHTMLGMPSPLAGGAGSDPAPPPGGVPAPRLAGAQAGLDPSADAPADPGRAPKSTMLGVPAVQPGDEPPGPQRRPASPGGRTMLGMPASVPPPSESMRPPGMAAAPPPAAEVGRERNPVAYGSDFPAADDPWDAPVEGSVAPGSGGKLPWLLIGAGGLLAVGALIFAVVWFLGAGGPEVEAAVVMTDRGEMLEVTLPGARPGTRVRLGDAELALDGNQARFPLAVDGLSVGDNELALDVVDPDGEVDTARLTLAVDFRVRADLGALRDDPPAVRIVVDAPPGTEASLDGETLALDDDGRGARRFELPEAPPDEDGTYDLSVAYHLELPSGEVEDGRVRTRVPYATLQLDRPGRAVVVDTDAVEVAGAVEAGASVTVDGAPVEVSDGRFRTTVAIPELGERTLAVVARQPGRAPARHEVRVTRVADLKRAARGFEADPTLSYVRIVQNPSIYRGQKVRMTGRVYNVRVEDGRSTLQVLVKECPRGEACPLWVVYPAATDASLNDWVEILGEVAGEQQFRAESGRTQTVPRVDALYLLEARP